MTLVQLKDAVLKISPNIHTYLWGNGIEIIRDAGDRAGDIGIDLDEFNHPDADVRRDMIYQYISENTVRLETMIDVNEL